MGQLSLEGENHDEPSSNNVTTAMDIYRQSNQVRRPQRVGVCAMLRVWVLLLSGELGGRRGT